MDWSFQVRNENKAILLDVDESRPENETLETLRDDAFRQTLNEELKTDYTLTEATSVNVKKQEEDSPETESSPKSIFDVERVRKAHFPQILTIFANHSDKKVLEKEARRCTLPIIKSVKSNESSPQNQRDIRSQKKIRKTSLFDFRTVGIQEEARNKQIRRLQRQGYQVTSQSKSSSRFVSKPYEGSTDDLSWVKKKSKFQSHPHHCNKPDTRQQNQPNKELSPPADEETLTKIEKAFGEWKLRKEKEEQRDIYHVRKRSSSHSPPRSTAAKNLFDTNSSLLNSCFGSAPLLHHRGNIRRGPKSGYGRKYKAIASPAVSRRSCDNGTRYSRNSTTATTIVPLASWTTKQRFEGVSTSPRPPSKSPHRYPKVLRNKRFSEILASEISFSSSLPNLNTDCPIDEMEANGHRPLSSNSRIKGASIPAGRSPKPPRKGVSAFPRQNEIETKENIKNSKTEETSAKPRRNITWNICLPTGSPTFQRAMKGMEIPDKEYSEIFGKKRRDSILQKYTLAENALNSFRDDYDQKTIKSSSDAIRRVTVRFQEDMKLMKSDLDDNDVKRPPKSILKKRRQSVDDLVIGTRKNLAKYLDSKLKGNEDENLSAE